VSVAAALVAAAGGAMWAVSEPAHVAETRAFAAPAAQVAAARVGELSAGTPVSPTASPFGALADGAVVPAAPAVARRSELNYPRHSGR
jgi:hypothetical protein